MPKITKIEAQTPTMPTKKKVAAYARVSLERGRLIHSLSAQVSHYSNFIQNNPAWEYVGVYADSGESGTGTGKGRGEFQRLLADCEAGKIDIILTKSISRFARNTVDLLETVRRLKELNISVRFEEQNIDSMSGDGELMLTILASFAQEESRSLSENVKWAIRKGFADGKPNSFQIYGYRWDGEKFIIHPEEAEAVRIIFADYLGGSSPMTIAKKLGALGYKPMYSDTFGDETIRSMLANNKYVGDLELQKYYVENHITHRKLANNGEMPKYLVTDAHEALVSREDFAKTQTELKKRSGGGYGSNPAINNTIFSKKIKCGNCGAIFHRKGRKRKGGSTFHTWRCNINDRKGKAHCPMRDVPEDKLKIAVVEVLGLDEFNEKAFIDGITHIIIPAQFVIELHLADGTAITKHWESTTKKDSWTPEAKARAATTLATRNKEKQWTPEERKKLSDAMKARYANKGDKQ